MKLTTVRIADPDVKGGILINEKDFDPKVHKRFDAKAEAKAEKDAKDKAEKDAK
jgi:hypothetical protein